MSAISDMEYFRSDGGGVSWAIGGCVIILSVVLFRSSKGHFKPENHFAFEAAAWYWHFVDVVWLFLFVSIYWWGGL